VADSEGKGGRPLLVQNCFSTTAFSLAINDDEADTLSSDSAPFSKFLDPQLIRPADSAPPWPPNGIVALYKFRTIIITQGRSPRWRGGFGDGVSRALAPSK